MRKCFVFSIYLFNYVFPKLCRIDLWYADSSHFEFEFVYWVCGNQQANK